MAMIGLPVTPAAYEAVKRIFPNTIGAATVSADGLIRVWLDQNDAERLGRFRSPGETYSDIILRLAKQGR